MTAPKVSGTIEEWNDARGFGFIAPSSGGDRVFLHVSAFSPRLTLGQRPQVGMSLRFGVETVRGKKRAIGARLAENSRLASPKLRTRPSSYASSAPARFAGVAARPADFAALVLFAAVYAFAAARWGVSPYWLLAYGGVSVVCFIVYALDKSASRTGRWRTRESTLHILALMCGWPGALVAQQWLRHKSRKTEFRVVFWFVVALNIGGFVLVHVPGLLERWAPGLIPLR